jgi:hypothetical protein
MSDAADEFRRKHIDDTNGVRWPSGDAAKTDVAQTLLGISGVGICDYWYEYARDLVVNPQPEKPYVRAWSEVAKKDRAFRDVFATLNDEQRQAVLRLLRQVSDGVVYSVFVQLDQFPHANVVINFVNREDDAAVYSVQALPGEFGLHERWHQWVQEFSDAADRPAG